MSRERQNAREILEKIISKVSSKTNTILRVGIIFSELRVIKDPNIILGIKYHEDENLIELEGVGYSCKLTEELIEDSLFLEALENYINDSTPYTKGYVLFRESTNEYLVGWSSCTLPNGEREPIFGQSFPKIYFNKGRASELCNRLKLKLKK